MSNDRGATMKQTKNVFKSMYESITGSQMASNLLRMHLLMYIIVHQTSKNKTKTLFF